MPPDTASTPPNRKLCRRSVLEPQMEATPPAEAEATLLRALRSGEALPPVEGQPSSARFSLLGRSLRADDHLEIAVLAWRQYRAHQFGEHSEACLGMECPEGGCPEGMACHRVHAARMVLVRLWIPVVPYSVEDLFPRWPPVVRNEPLEE